MTTRGRKQRPGRITFVGSGPGDPGLLTTRARAVLANAALIFTDPDVPEAVLALCGSELPPPSGPEPVVTATHTDGDGETATTATIPGGPDIRPAWAIPPRWPRPLPPSPGPESTSFGSSRAIRCRWIR
jgi:uroporphyrinogen III methyltransferase/synthase